MHWLMITRKLDPSDDRTGFIMQWVLGLAEHLDHLDVICQEQAGTSLPANVSVYSMGKERGAGRLAQAWSFTRHLARLTPQVDGVFCHMIPRYVIFAAPWTALHRKPLLHWYTHRQISPELRAARRLATHILTAAPGSYPLPTPKRRVMGHGIDPALFPAPGAESVPPEIVMVGRLSAIKGQDRLLRAASLAMAQAGASFRVQIVGGAVESEQAYADRLHALPAQLSPAPDVTFTGPLPHDAAADILQHSALAVNLSPPGLFDKSALEPMFAGKPVIVTNRDFAPLLGQHEPLLYLPHDASDQMLAEHLGTLLALTPEQRAAIGAELRERAVAAHSLPQLIARIVDVMREAAHA